MNRPNAITVATVTAIVLAGFASVSVYSYLKKQAANSLQGVTIATAAADIPVGTALDSPMVKLVKWPKESVPPGACTNPAALKGRVAVRPLVAGDAVTEQKLLPLNGAAGAGAGVMSYLVPAGHRAVTVAINEVAGVAGFLTPHSRVDVVLNIPQPGSRSDQENNIAKVILQNVPVLATGQVTDQKEGKPVVVPTATLDLAPGDAEKLIVGTKKGSLQLLLRNVTDVAMVDTGGATVAKALGGGEPAPARVASPPVRVVKVKKVQMVAKAAAPAPAPSNLYRMEIIKGSARSNGEFPSE
ncbi:MAG TPA: Flp pilus assembly protein CpaB [Geomonas sp.]|nr:Flp pilus assembly protein CpaB [Geomonas sp.]